jgi:hypothetical protein
MIINGYPEKLLDKIISAFFNRICAGKSTTTNENAQPLMLVLPYLGNRTKQLEKKLKKALRETVPDLQVQFVFRAATRAISSDSKTRSPNTFLLVSSTNSRVVGATPRTSARRFAMQNDATKNIWGNLLLLGEDLPIHRRRPSAIMDGRVEPARKKTISKSLVEKAYSRNYGSRRVCLSDEINLG